MQWMLLDMGAMHFCFQRSYNTLERCPNCGSRDIYETNTIMYPSVIKCLSCHHIIIIRKKDKDSNEQKRNNK